VGSTHLSSTIRPDDTPKVRFTATLSEEPVVEVALGWRLGARALPIRSCAGGSVLESPRPLAQRGCQEYAIGRCLRPNPACMLTGCTLEETENDWEGVGGWSTVRSKEAM
jgi:hypothetical protein